MVQSGLGSANAQQTEQSKLALKRGEVETVGRRARPSSQIHLWRVWSGLPTDRVTEIEHEQRSHVNGPVRAFGVTRCITDCSRCSFFVCIERLEYSSEQREARSHRRLHEY